MLVEFDELRPGLIGVPVEVSFEDDGTLIVAGGRLASYVRAVKYTKKFGWVLVHIGNEALAHQYEKISSDKISRMEFHLA